MCFIGGVGMLVLNCTKHTDTDRQTWHTPHTRTHARTHALTHSRTHLRTHTCLQMLQSEMSETENACFQSIFKIEHCPLVAKLFEHIITIETHIYISSSESLTAISNSRRPLMDLVYRLRFAHIPGDSHRKWVKTLLLYRVVVAYVVTCWFHLLFFNERKSINPSQDIQEDKSQSKIEKLHMLIPLSRHSS